MLLSCILLMLFPLTWLMHVHTQAQMPLLPEELSYSDCTTCYSLMVLHAYPCCGLYSGAA